MRFLCDMAISPKTAAFLRSQGHDAIHLWESGLYRAFDEQILAKAFQENRIVLTADLDFGYLLAVSKARLPSVVIFRQENKTADRINEILGSHLEDLESAATEGIIMVVDDGGVRLRRLPLP